MSIKLLKPEKKGGKIVRDQYVWKAKKGDKFEIKDNSIENLMIISHAGTMSVLLSYFLNMPLYAWTWKKFLPKHTGHTRLKSTAISDGHFFRLKEFNNVSFIENPEEQTY